MSLPVSSLIRQYRLQKFKNKKQKSFLDLQTPILKGWRDRINDYDVILRHVQKSFYLASMEF